MSLADMVLHSRFDKKDIEKESKVIIGEISMSKDAPNELVGMILDELLWPAPPAGTRCRRNQFSLSKRWGAS